MEESTSFWQLALQTNTIDGTLTEYLCHVKAQNWTYTIVRSILLASPDRLDEIFDNLHSFEHKRCNPTKRSKTKQQDRPILLYWREKAEICEDCTSFLIQLLASSWRRNGLEISENHNYSRLCLTKLQVSSCELITVMANLFKYMSTAYERLEKETKDALQAETYSTALTDACKEYYGENFDVNKDVGRLEALLTSLHKTNVNFLFARLLGGHHIDDTIERDKQALSKPINSTEGISITLFEDVDSQTEYQVALTPTKGKNHEQNRKKMERKKKKRATTSKNSQAKISNDPKDLLKETVDKSTISVDCRDEPVLEGENGAQISQNSTVVTDVYVAQSAASAKIIDESSAKDDITVPPTTVEQSIKIDYLTPSYLSEATDSASKSPVVSVEEQIANVGLKLIQGKKESYQYEKHLETTVEIEDDQNWTQVGGSRKKSKSNSSGINSNENDSSPVKGSPRFAGFVKKPQGGVNLGTALEIAPSPTRRGQTFGLVLKQQMVSKAVSNSINSKLSGSTKPLSASIVPNPSTPKRKAPKPVDLPTAVEKTDIVSITPEQEQKLEPLQTPAQVSVAIGHEQEIEALQTPVQVSITVGQEAESEVLHTPTKVPVDVKQVEARPEPGPGSYDSTIEDHTLPTTSSGDAKKQVSISGAISAKYRVNILPSVPEVSIVSTTPLAPNSHFNFASPGTSTNLTAFILAATATSTTDGHRYIKKPALTSSSASIDPATIAASIAGSHCDTGKSARFLPSESIDPGPVPYYQHLQPFKRRGGRKMSETTEARLANHVTHLSHTFSLVENLRDAGVEDNAMSSLVSRAAVMAMTSFDLPLPNTDGVRLRAFGGKHLDVRRANLSPRSAGNSPVPPQPEREPVYHYPPPDVLTPENQEILGLIIKGPPYKKYPRVPTAADQQNIQPLAADFMTKKLPVVNYDGKDAYEVLGDRCPVPITLKDHPNVNKCIQQGEIFRCAYCRIEILGNAELEKGIICPGCGPCSETRYCQRSHLLADSISHSEVCCKEAGTYPLMWSELPLDYHSLYPYIKPLTGTMTAQCFRQMAHCLVINSDGIIENPFKAYYETQMAMEDKVKVYNWIQEMYQFQDKGCYYLFHPNPVAGGVDIEITITLPDGSGGCFREDQRFARVRNAAFMTQHPTLLCVLYRRIKDAIKTSTQDTTRYWKRMYFLDGQFHEEFPSLNLATIAPLDEDYCFENDWKHVRRLVHDLELGNPILRAWFTEDAEDDGIPTDPTVRYQGSYWDFVHGPTFRAGSADRKDWGAGWFGGNEKKWQKQLDRKYLKMVTDELAKIETELEGDII